MLMAGGSLFLKKAKNKRGLLERLMGVIPGYHGYKKRELRRETDRLVRMKIVTHLQEAKDTLRRSLSSPSAFKSLSSEDMWTLDALMARLDRVTQRIDRAVAGYSGFFDVVKVREEDLDKVIEHDFMLIKRGMAIQDKANDIVKLEPGTPEWRDAVNALISEIEALDRLIDTRTEILRGLSH